MGFKSGYQGYFNPAAAATIASGQTVSSAIPCAGFVLCAVQLPAAFTGTALKFQASLDGTTYQPVYSSTSGTELSYTVAQGHFVALDPKDFQGAAFIKLVSGTAEGADRALVCSLKGF